MINAITVTIRQKEDYKFLVDFGAGWPEIVADEPAPVGKGAGPAPPHFLLAAVANCLSSSLLFSIQKFKQDVGSITATASCIVDRNENNRLRVKKIDVTIQLGKRGPEIEHLDRVLAQFEDFCTVTQSIRSGIPIEIKVNDESGKALR